jgi:hypothetical protein
VRCGFRRGRWVQEVLQVPSVRSPPVSPGSRLTSSA